MAKKGLEETNHRLIDICHGTFQQRLRKATKSIKQNSDGAFRFRNTNFQNKRLDITSPNVLSQPIYLVSILNIKLSSMPTSVNWSFPCMFNRNYICATCPAHHAFLI